MVDDGQRCRVSQSIGLADHETVEGIARVESVLDATRRHLFGLRLNLGGRLQFKGGLEWRRSLAALVTVQLFSWPGLGVGVEFDTHRRAEDFGYRGMDGRAELALEPGYMERIGSRDADDARAWVIRQTASATQVSVVVGFARVDFQKRQHALPDNVRIVALRVGLSGRTRR